MASITVMAVERRNRIIRWSVLFLFLLVFSLVSFVNHYNFRTYAYDLGLYDNVLYSYSHLEINAAPLLRPYHQIENTLADHFSLLPMAFAWFRWLFGSYTLLVFQILGILFGAYGFSKWVQLKFSNDSPMLASALVYFLLFWGIYSALAYDYHDNVVGAMFVPWIFYFFEKRKFAGVTVFTILLLISKENMALWSFFIFGGLAFSSFRDRKALIASSLLAIFSIGYFLLMVKVVIPSLGTPDEQGYIHFHYKAIGNSFSEVFQNLVKKPLYFIELLYKNHSTDPMADNVKWEMHSLIALSGGVFLLLRPQYLFMLIPIYLQKFYHDDFTKWGSLNQYSIEFVPIISVAAFSVLSKIKKPWIQKALAVLLIGTTFWATWQVLHGKGDPYFYYSKDRQDFFSKEHYTRDFNVKQVHKDLRLVPPGAAVSANASIVSHLAYRKKIYHFPNLFESEYVVILNDGSVYPLNTEQFAEKVEELKKAPEWEKVLDQNSLLIFKRK